jgi:hypothetical protein
LKEQFPASTAAIAARLEAAAQGHGSRDEGAASRSSQREIKDASGAVRVCSFRELRRLDYLFGAGGATRPSPNRRIADIAQYAFTHVPHCVQDNQR